jgi:hypothetical protein
MQKNRIFSKSTIRILTVKPGFQNRGHFQVCYDIKNIGADQMVANASRHAMGSARQSTQTIKNMTSKSVGAGLS